MEDKNVIFVSKIREYKGEKDVFDIALESGFNKNELKTIVPAVLAELASIVYSKSQMIDDALRETSDQITIDLGWELHKVEEEVRRHANPSKPEYIELSKVMISLHDRYVKHTGMDKEQKIQEKSVDLSGLSLEEQEQFLSLLGKLNV
jgi:hypothetical protein